MELCKLQDDIHEFSSRFYSFHKVFDCDINNIVKYPIVPFMHGGLFLGFNSSRKELEIINNLGDIIFRHELCIEDDVLSAFWCGNGDVGVLTSKGDVLSINFQNEITNKVSVTENNCRVLFFYPFYNGVAFFTESKKFYLYEYFNYGIDIFYSLDGEEEPSIIYYDNKKGFLFFKDGRLVVIEKNISRLICILDFVPLSMKVSMDRTYLGLRSESKIEIVPIDKNHEEIIKWNFESSDIAWITDDTLITISKFKLYFLNINKEIKPLSQMVNAIALFQDLNHIRIFGEKEVFILQRTPESVLEIIKDDNIKYLNKAFIQYQQKSIGSYKILKNIDNIMEISSHILLAASEILDPFLQEYLFQLSSFINICFFDIQTKKYISLLNQTRFLNSLRSKEIGFTTTMKELLDFGIENFYELIINLKFYDFAFQVAKLFSFNQNQIAEKWAMSMILKYREKSLLKILKMLEQIQGIDYLKITKYALCNKISQDGILTLTNKIVNPLEKILILFNLQGTEPLETAIKYKDGDTIVRVIYWIKNKSSEEEFINMLNSSQLAAITYSNIRASFDLTFFQNLTTISKSKYLSLIMNYGLNNNKISNWKNQMDDIKQYLPDNSVFKTIINNQIEIHELSGEKQLKSARRIVLDAIKDKKFDFAFNISKKYQISSHNFAFICAKTLAKNQMWNEFNVISKSQPYLKPEELSKICLDEGNKELSINYANNVINNSFV